MVLGTGHSGLGNHDLLLCRLNESGDTVWTKSYGTAEFDFAQNIRQTSDLEFLIAGDGYDSNGNQEIILLKTDSAGIVLWSRSYGTSGDEEVKDVLLTANGELILCGILDGGSNDVNSFAMKVDQNGDTVWVKSYGDISHDELRGMNMASNGDLLLFGATNSFGASFFTSQLMRLSSDGSGAGCYEGGATMSLDTVQMMSRRGLAVGSGGAEFTLSVNDSSISFPYNLLCTTVGVQTSLPEAQLLAYPNPTSGHIRIIGKPGSKGRLVDLNGRLHMEVDMVDRETEFNISHLPSGVYFLLTENSSLKITRL